jgi:hypothetical protein
MMMLVAASGPSLAASTMNVIEALLVLPALSSASAEYVFGPGSNDQAGALMSWQVSVATPERASLASQSITTCAMIE